MQSGLPVGKSLSRAQKAMKAGQAQLAADLFRDVLVRFPGNKRAKNGLQALGVGGARSPAAEAQALQARGELSAAEAQRKRAIARDPDAPKLKLALALCQLEHGKPKAALQATQMILDRQPDHPVALDIRGNCLRDLGDDAGAEAAYRAALGHGAADASPLNQLGVLAQAQGKRGAAEGYYRQALALCPDKADLHHNLSRALTYTRDEPHLAQMLALAADGADNPDQAPLHFALFKALSDLAEPEAAFAHLARANKLKKTSLAYDVRRDAVLFAFLKSLFPDPLTGSADPDDRLLTPVFVTGLPRSGTTLVERILAATPGAVAGGELSVVSNAVAPLLRELQARQPHNWTERDISDLRSALRSDLAERADGAAVLIDKMPLNFRWLGFIAAALPEARIVHMNRDPMAVAASLYKHLFAGRGNGFAYDIADIAAYMLLHRDLMTHWRKVCGVRIREVDYAALTAEPDREIPALVVALGLEWSEDCLAPHRANGAVLTASSDQVRRPIYTGSDEGWRAEANELAPLRHALKVSGII